jgi:uncharacterized protein (TIGR04255 family)
VNSGEHRPHPEFDDPPVVETLLGVEFGPLARWQVPHFGLFWSRIREEYPHVEEQPPLAGSLPTNEAGELILRMTPPAVRCWFLEQRKARLLQVQRDRFIHNWRKRPAADAYPRYENLIRPTFEREWDRFCEFLRDETLGKPEVTGCEVTYVNQFERGREWEQPGDVVEVVSFLRRIDSSFLPAFGLGRTSLSFDMGSEGSLHVDLVRAIRNADAAEIFQLTLSAKGRPAVSSTESIMQWFDVGRAWVVDGFVDLTTPAMHKLWKRTR